MPRPPSNPVAEERAWELLRLKYETCSITEIAKLLHDEFPEESVSTSRNRVERAARRLERVDTSGKPLRKHFIIKRLVDMANLSWEKYQETGKAAHLVASGACLTQLAKIDGFFAPEQLEVKSQAIAPEELTPHEQRETIKRWLDDPHIKALAAGEELPDIVYDIDEFPEDTEEEI